MSKYSWASWVGVGAVILSLSSCSSGDDTSGSPNGGAPSGGSSNAGSSHGGSPNGGSPAGGSPSGGSPSGGSPSGGSPSGGSSNAGSANMSGNGGKSGSGGTSAGSGGSGGTLGGAGAGGVSSVPDAGAAGSEGGAPDTGPVTCAATCPFNVCAGADCAVTKVVSVSNPYDVTTVGGAAFWTTISTISACPSPPCAVGTPLVTSTSGSHTYTSITTAQSASVDYLFTSDNTGGYGVWRTGLTGTPHADWATAQNNAGALAISGGVIVFGDQSRTYRGTVGAMGVTTVMNVGPGFFSAAGQGNEALHNVAIDATSVFAASASDVYKCPVAATCLTNPATAGTTAMPKVMALAINAGRLYALGGSPFAAGGRETLWSVSTSGGVVSEVGHVDVAIDGQGSSFGLLVDGETLYFGSFDGNLYTCQKSACTPKVLVPGAKPFGLAQDSTYVYWASYWGGGVYRVLKPTL